MPLTKLRCEAVTMTILMHPDDLLKPPNPSQLDEPPKTVTGRCENEAKFEVQGYNVCAGHRAKILRGENLSHG